MTKVEIHNIGKQQPVTCFGQLDYGEYFVDTGVLFQKVCVHSKDGNYTVVAIDLRTGSPSMLSANAVVLRVERITVNYTLK